MASGSIDQAGQASIETDVAEQWAGDPLAQYLAAAWRNTVNAFSAERQRYRAMCDVDGVYRRLVESLDSTSDRLASTFVVRSHGSFLAAASLGLSGQAAEAYALMRASLETAALGLYVASTPERQQLWVSRNDDEAARNRLQSELLAGAPLAHLKETDPATAAIYQKLFDRTVDRGSHPNSFAKPNGTAGEGAAAADLTREYFVCDDDVQRSCLRSIAQVGICCLCIFYYVFPQRYRELELDVSLNKLQQGH
jgi:hypothetical protein